MHLKWQNENHHYQQVSNNRESIHCARCCLIHRNLLKTIHAYSGQIFLSTYYVPIPMLGVGYIVMKSIYRILSASKAYSLGVIVGMNWKRSRKGGINERDKQWFRGENKLITEANLCTLSR